MFTRADIDEHNRIEDAKRREPSEEPARNYLQEALRLMAGTTIMLPQDEHLDAIRHELREGRCLCGHPVADHFDARNRFVACETLIRRRRARDEQDVDWR